MADSKAKLRTQYIEDIFEAMYTVRRYFASSWTKRDSAQASKITPSQWMALVAVSRNENLSVKDLAADLGITSSAATQLVTELVNKGYLARKGSADDRRVLLLSLTSISQQKLENLRQKQIGKLARMFDGLTENELKLYSALNKKISEHLANHKHD